MNEKAIIPPTVGRKVWFYPGANQNWPEGMVCYPGGQPLDATVVYVHSDRMVNLLVLDHTGKPSPLRSVTLVQPGDQIDGSSHRAEWMPYQVGQAKR